jgi:hypothetical protein
MKNTVRIKVSELKTGDRFYSMDELYLIKSRSWAKSNYGKFFWVVQNLTTDTLETFGFGEVEKYVDKITE